MYLRMQAAREGDKERGQGSARTANQPPETAAPYVEAEPATTPGPEADGTDSSKTKTGGATGDDQPGSGTEGAGQASNIYAAQGGGSSSGRRNRAERDGDDACPQTS